MMSATQKTILGHPRGLFVLFFTEMWERFNYYGMRALLILYMVNYLKWPQEEASTVYKWFTGLVYLTPLIGGFLADKYLGNKWAIVLGALTMAIGQFCMAIDSQQVFYLALGLLICGNGLFKPNMATQVGRLYPPNDTRRDSAYTIFYMGVNLGAFFAPLICSWLQENTVMSYRAGFVAAGVGMLIGLVTYLVGLKWIREDTALAAASAAAAPKTGGVASSSHYMTEQEASTTNSAVPLLAGSAPQLMLVLMALVLIVPWILAGGFGILKYDDAGAYSIGGGIACFMGWMILSKIANALRDRVMVVYILGLFVIFFWGAFEQAGNAMNIFADKTTNRYLTETPPTATMFMGGDAAASAGGGLLRAFNPIPTGWFQSINALAIFLLAPVFAWLWVFLPRIGLRIPTPAKIAIGVFVQGLAFMLMYWAIRYEAQPSAAPLAALPPGTIAQADGRVVFRDAPNLDDEKGFKLYASATIDEKDPKVIQGGRIRFDPAKKQLDMTGVLADTDRDRLLRATVPTAYLNSIREFVLASAALKSEAGKNAPVQVSLDPPPGFDLRFAALPAESVRYDASSKTLSTTIALGDRDFKSLLVAGANPGLRESIFKLYLDSSAFKVSSWWLFWFYILCTIGELCLSPVGLSMVSKLAPAAYGTMMMGMWHVMIFFGNYTAGQLGEMYGTLDPGMFFVYIGGSLIVVSIICFFVVKKVKSMMHGVN